LLVALIDELVRRGGESCVPTIEDVRGTVPYRVSHGLLTQCKRLPPAATALVRAVAVLGDGVELLDAAALASIDSSVAGEAADALVRAGIMQAGGRLTIAQPIIRSAVYAGLSTTAKSLAHARAARLLAGAHAAPHRTATHLLATEPVGEPWALESLRQAARQAIGHESAEMAAAYLRRALREPLDSEQRVDILRELGIAEARVALPSAVGHFQAALEIHRAAAHDSLQLRAEIVRLLSGSLVIADRGEEALSVVEAAIAELGEGERVLRLGLEAQLAAVAVLYGGHAAAGGRRLADLEQELRAADGAEGRLLAMLAHRRTHSSTDADHAAHLAARALAEGQRLSEPVDSLPLFLAGAMLDLAGRPGDGEQLFSDLLERASLSGDAVRRSFAAAGRSLARLHRGAVPDAMTDAENALDAATARGRNTVGRHASMRCLILAAIEHGQLDRCDRELDRHDLTGELPDTVPGNQLLIARGRLRLAQREPHQALTDLVSAGCRAQSWGQSIQFEWRDPAAIAHDLLGHRRVALALARQSRELASRWGAARQIGAALCTLGVIEGGPDGVEHLREAVEVLEGSGAHLQHARALVNLGALLRETGQPGDARRYLHVGLERSTSLGAHALARAAGAQLAAAGVPARERSEHGRSGTLTPAERRIAEMAATGLSNPEIARALFVSRKTVEMHLGNSYRKLGISARGQLAAAVGAS
jgi:DNA-binding CsgD family transcriptional regulator